MDYTNSSSLLLKRPVTIKAIVTAKWKEEVQQQLQNQIGQLDQQMQQIQMQGQRTMEEIQKKAPQPGNQQVSKQIESIQAQVNQKKSEMLDKKNQFLQQLQQIQLLELDKEVVQAQMESFFRIEKGDNLVKKLNVEVVLRDGVVEEIRGEL
ncbi:MAG: YlqD family protein [Pleurocapsa sp.]